MRTAEVARQYPVAEGTLRYYRHLGIGPDSVKIGRRVVYKRSDLEAWLAALEREQHGDRKAVLPSRSAPRRGAAAPTGDGA